MGVDVYVFLYLFVLFTIEMARSKIF